MELFGQFRHTPPVETTEAAVKPPLLRGRVYADFGGELAYFTTAFDLILSLYELLPADPVVADFRESLRAPETLRAPEMMIRV